ncbi:domain found in IF2B/IF5-domain-containing protein [Syncephalis fuscata]|nr:domain found in IF2B/IF5-domain-containing protein [Syncephalis fuscata]
MKKKKKKKKVADVAAEDAEPTETAQPAEEAAEDGEEAEDFDFSMKKKKKKPKKKVQFEGEEDENVGDVDAEAAEDGDEAFGDEAEDADETEATNVADEQAWLGSDRDYTYQELLGRVFNILRQKNPELSGEKRRYIIAPPVMERDGKKSAFSNIADICKRMNRPMEHLIQFLLTELGTTGSVDGSNRLIIKGRFQQRNMEHMLRRYIREYVTCKTCKSPDTIITKENRLFFMQCESCGSTRSVATIKSGYVAQTTKRSVLRRAAGQ